MPLLRWGIWAGHPGREALGLGGGRRKHPGRAVSRVDFLILHHAAADLA